MSAMRNYRACLGRSPRKVQMETSRKLSLESVTEQANFPFQAELAIQSPEPVHHF